MNTLTKLFLVLLRLAIGWHFFFEGLEKIESIDRGPTETNRPWTSEPYLREATGPLGDFFRGQIGDQNDDALAKLTVRPLAPNEDPAHLPPYTRLPAGLDQEWNAYFQRFVAYYQLDRPGDDSPVSQFDLAAKKLQQAKDNTALWLLRSSKKSKKTFPSGTVEVNETMAKRVDDYRRLVENMRGMEENDLPAFGRDVRKDKLRNLKADVNRARAELLQELAAQTQDMKNSLETVLNPDQKNKGPVPPLMETRPIDRIDLVTRYGLTLVGACLLLGLCTRPACLAGAAFLLLFYLTMPPFPWVPENLRAEGHYLFINKNMIEALALLALATTPSGRWAGLDALMPIFKPRRASARVDSDPSGSIR